MKSKTKKNIFCAKSLPLAITGMLAGAIIGGASEVYIISLAIILYTMGFIKMLLNKGHIEKYIFSIFFAGYLIFLYQTLQILSIGEVANPSVWYLLDGLVGWFAYLTADKINK